MSTSLGTTFGTAYTNLGKIVAFGGIRYDPDTGLFKIINDTDHKPSGITEVETLDDCVRLHHPRLTPGVGAPWCNPDERYTLNGVHVGISGGLDYAEMWFTVQKGDPPYARMNPTDAAFRGEYTNVWFGIVVRS